MDDWLDRVAEQLGLLDATVDANALLDVTREVAHGVARPAGPLTTYLIGVAVGRGADPREAIAQVSALLPTVSEPS